MDTTMYFLMHMTHSSLKLGVSVLLQMVCSPVDRGSPKVTRVWGHGSVRLIKIEIQETCSREAQNENQEGKS